MKKFLIGLLALSIVATTGVAGWRGYKVWKQDRQVRQARAFLARGELRNALLSVQQAVHSNPSNLDACRLMADLAEQAHSPSALGWRSRIVELEPAPLSNRLAWARSALMLNDVHQAARALAGADAASKQTAAYHKAAAALAVAAQELPAAETHFSEALRLEPDNPVSQLNLAIIRLRASDAAVATQARATLESLRANPVVRADALRQLALETQHKVSPAAALKLSEELLTLPNAVFNDRLLHLELVQKAAPAQFPKTLAALQQSAVTNLGSTYDLMKWMLTAGQAPAALVWFQTLPPASQTNLPLPLIAAECYAAQSNWAGLLTYTERQKWGELDYFRLADRTRAFKALSNTMTAKAEWLRAVKSADNRVEQLSQLLRAVTAWGWDKETEDVLWAIVNGHPQEKWAVEALVGKFYAAGNTRALQRVYLRVTEANGSDATLKNNLAMVSLLLSKPEKHTHELAREVYQKDGKNPYFASTYAYSLHLQEKSADALKVLDQLEPKQLEIPSIAAFYGVILEASGNGVRAKKFLELAGTAKLLPEELALVQTAQARL